MFSCDVVPLFFVVGVGPCSGRVVVVLFHKHLFIFRGGVGGGIVRNTPAAAAQLAGGWGGTAPAWGSLLLHLLASLCSCPHRRSYFLVLFRQVVDDLRLLGDCKALQEGIQWVNTFRTATYLNRADVRLHRAFAALERIHQLCLFDPVNTASLTTCCKCATSCLQEESWASMSASSPSDFPMDRAAPPPRCVST